MMEENKKDIKEGCCPMMACGDEKTCGHQMMCGKMHKFRIIKILVMVVLFWLVFTVGEKYGELKGYIMREGGYGRHMQGYMQQRMHYNNWPIGDDGSYGTVVSQGKDAESDGVSLPATK